MSNWISVNDSLPTETGVKYIVFDNNGVSSAYFDMTGENEPFWYDDYEINNEEVKFWRLAPQPPSDNENKYDRLESMYSDLELMVMEITSNPINTKIGTEYRSKKAIFLNEIKYLLAKE